MSDQMTCEQLATAFYEAEVDNDTLEMQRLSDEYFSRCGSEEEPGEHPGSGGTGAVRRPPRPGPK